MRHTAFLIAVVLGFSLPGVSGAQDKESPAIAKAIQGTPKLDGVPDKAWEKAPKFKVNKPIVGLLQIDEKDMAQGTVQFMWDTDHLFALWIVKDPKLSAEEVDPWEQDSVELFVDQNKKATTSYEKDDAQYRVNFKGKISGQGEGFDEKLLKAAASTTKDGYVVEMALKIKHVELKPETKLGVEMQINDDAGDGSRSAIAKWHHTEDDSWEDTSNFGTLLIQ